MIRCTCRACRHTDSTIFQRMEQDFAPHSGKSRADNVRSASFICKSMHFHIANLWNTVYKMRFQFPHMLRFQLKILIDHFWRQCQSCDSRYVFRSWAHIFLLTASENDRFYLHTAVHIKKSRPFRSVNLMSAGRKHIDSKSFRIDLILSESLNRIRMK